MPRNPAAKKHQHNNRHENGLVGPGKRVTKQKSNGHLNGTPKGPVPNEPVPTTNHAGPAALNGDHSSGSSSESRQEVTRRTSHPPLKSHDSDDPNTPEKDPGNKHDTANGTAMLQQRRVDPGVSKGKVFQDVSALQIASTILKSRPATDTVALLIVLLALPSMVLTIVQALFASLTLVPGTSTTSLLALFDIFQGSPGAPSLGTMAWVDVILFGLWICLWSWAQNFALDLAQIQIAITLGNGNSGKGGSINTLCFVGVLLLHLVRSRGVRRFLYLNLVPVDLLSQAGMADYLRYLPADSDFGDSPGPPSKIRSLFAIHIISQGVMAFVRRRVAHSQAASTAKSKRIDTEALAGSAPEAPNIDGAGAAGTASGVDYQPPPTPSFPKDGKERAMTAKKRRRHANLVRIRQPFWAALANTKVHVFREVEHSRNIPATSNAGQAVPFETPQQDLVWVTNVDSSSITFEANFIPSQEHDQEHPASDDSQPFYVCINKARWQVQMEPLEKSSATEGLAASWTGYISGLAPNCTYTCTFIRSDNNKEFASVMVKTPMINDNELPSSTTPAPIRQPSRPSSPTTTLKNSIATAEAKLNDARNRLTKVRRQHKATLAKIEKEVDSFNSRLKSSSDDTKQKQKLLQAERSIRQTEDATKEIDAALEELVSTPDDDLEEHKALSDAYEQQVKQLSEANEALDKARSSANHELSCVSNELQAVNGRKERLTARNTKLAEQNDRITQANVQGMNEKERKAAESSAKDAEQQRREAELGAQIRYMENELRAARVRWETNCRDLEALEQQEMLQRQMMLRESGPLTPEGELPGTRPQPQQARPYAFGSFQAYPNTGPVYPEIQSSPFLAYAKTLPSSGNLIRPRSNTNQSAGANSNFSADFEDADPIPPMPSTMEYETGRKGSGSSRGKNNGSPAGVIGGALRSPQRRSYSPGHIPGSTTW